MLVAARLSRMRWVGVVVIVGGRGVVGVGWGGGLASARGGHASGRGGGPGVRGGVWLVARVAGAEGHVWLVVCIVGAGGDLWSGAGVCGVGRGGCGCGACGGWLRRVGALLRAHF